MSFVVKRLVFIANILVLSACSSWVDKGDGPPSTPPGDLVDTPDAIPKVERTRPANQKSYVVFGKRYYPMASSKGYREKGIASWYGKQFHGNPTATGEKYDMYEMTAAHKTLPLPSYVEVRHLDNGRKIVVRVNDRGPFHSGRIIDLSYAAASKLGIVGTGTGRVEVIAIDPRTYGKPSAPTVAAKSAPVVSKAAVAQPMKNQAVAVTPTVQPDKAAVYLQIGTFSSLSRAEAFKNRVVAHVDQAVFLSPVSQPHGTMYRVRVGPLTDISASEALANKLKSLGVPDSHAVVE